MIGVSPPLYPRRVEFFSKDRAFSIEKARRLLGYNPQFDLSQGLRRTALWYRENGFLDDQNQTVKD
jgi:nucleoside-diphosphate-sugar epimerase